jgi:magnesium chelatase family protein
VPVRVEVDISNGLPAFTIVGLTDRAIQEARERVKPAIRNAGFKFPQRRVTVNLAPAELPKEGTAFDLAHAVPHYRSARAYSSPPWFRLWCECDTPGWATITSLGPLKVRQHMY